MKKGWKTVRLGDIAIIKGGKRVPKGYKLSMEPTCHKYIRVADFNAKGTVDLSNIQYITDDVYQQIKNYTISKNDVYVSIAGTIGKTGIIPEELDGANLTENACKLVLSECIDKHFVYYFTCSCLFTKQIEQLTMTSAQPKLALTRLTTVEISFPPLSEQEEIVTYLDTSFAKIDAIKANAEKELEEAKKLFAAALNEAMTPKEGWVEKKLNQISEYSIGLTYKPINVSNKGTIVLRSSNIQNDKVDLTDIVRVNCPIKDKLYVQKGDILMCSRNGSSKLVGKVALIDELKEEMTYGTFMMIIRSKYSKYLFYFFKSDVFRSQIKHGEANMINQITRYMLDDVKVHMPDYSIQHSVVTHLDTLSEKVRQLQSNYEKISSECDALKQAILRDTFE